MLEPLRIIKIRLHTITHIILTLTFLVILLVNQSIYKYCHPDSLIHFQFGIFASEHLCNDILLWMIQSWVKNHLLSDTKCNATYPLCPKKKAQGMSNNVRFAVCVVDTTRVACNQSKHHSIDIRCSILIIPVTRSPEFVRPNLLITENKQGIVPNSN